MNDYRFEQLLDQVQVGQINIEEAVKVVLDLKAKSVAQKLPGPALETFRYGEPFLRDHTVSGRQVLLGVTHASVAINKFFDIFPHSRSVRVERLAFVKPIVLEPGQQVQFRVEASPRESSADFKTLYRHDSSGEWSVGATGTLVEGAFEPERKVLDDLRASMQELQDSETIYESPLVALGETFKTVTQVYVGNSSVLARFVLRESVHAEKHTYILHPHILNCPFLALPPLLHGLQLHDAFLPFGINTIHFERTATLKQGWVLVQLLRTSGEIIIFDAGVMTDGGQVVGRLSGASIKRLRSVTSPEKTISTPPLPASTREDGAGLLLKIKEYLIDKVSRLAKGFSPSNLTDNFMELGLESSQLVSLTQEIGNEANIHLNPTLFFEYPNAKELSEFFRREYSASFSHLLDTARARASFDVGLQPPVTLRRSAPVAEDKQATDCMRDIAVIGMSGRFADAPSLDQYWLNLRDRKDLIREIPVDHWDYRPWFDANPESKDRTYCKWGSFLEDVDKFDAEFFKISPREAEWMDPQLRLLLQTVYAVGEDAGYINLLRGTNTGVFVGVCSHDYADRIMELNLPVNPHIGTGLTLTAMANRISFLFDLTGPSIGVDTACSSSLVALHAACSALRNRECGMAFVAGVNLLLSSFHYRYFSSIGALSPTGRCHSFDASADGYVPGEGVGCILLKPLVDAERDGDRIDAVIKGSAALHGGYTPSLTAPSVAGEENVILKAWDAAGIDPASLSYIEAHGTGTKLGDPIEIAALNKAFRRFTPAESFCAIGSAKSSIGHGEGAAGIAGVLKVILQLQHRVIPAMPQFRQLNPYIQLDHSPLYINWETQEWKRPAGFPLRAGVSSFGFSGSYAHAVIEEYKPTAKQSSVIQITSQTPALIVLSARNRDRLRDQAGQLLDLFQTRRCGDADLPDIAYTLQIAREAMDERLAFTAGSAQELRDKLQTWVDGREDIPGLYSGRARNRHDPESTRDANTILETCNREHSPSKLIEQWAKGQAVDWRKIWGSEKPQLARMPAYPFAKKRHWIAELDVKATLISQSAAREVPAIPESTTTAADSAAKPVKISLRSLSKEPPTYATSVIQSLRVAPVASSRAVPAPQPERPGQIEIEDSELQKLAQELTASLAQILYLTPQDIRADVKFVDMGLDSILGVEWLRTINKKYGVALQGGKLYDNPTVLQLARFLAQEMSSRKGEPAASAQAAVRLEIPILPQPSASTLSVAQSAAETEVSVSEAPQSIPPAPQKSLNSSVHDIAIISLSGRYPGARNLEAFLQNLQNGKDCITEIPPDRWDHSLYFDQDRTQIGKTYCKWGGFLEGVDEFDPLFFNISPREAEGMDPKIRLFLETVWNLFETAGYTREALARRYGSKVGVFVGAMYHYADAQRDAIHTALTTLSSYSYIANRTSYFFNLRGPSVAIDTACSSSLIAIHMACESLRQGECRMAVAGGVNLSSTPSKYLGLSLVQMVGSDPQNCRTFGDGDGFLPSEGVGAVLLKPLSEAVQDGDGILAVIKSTAVDHKGFTPEGFYVPDATAQARLIKDNFDKSGVHPRWVSYAESAASGYAPGDAAEIEALNRVFRQFTPDRHFCSIGSVKSNIGHAEAASGISQLTKVVLQLQQQQIFPTLNGGRLNPRINFDDTPFTVERKLKPWIRPRIKLGAEEREMPRCATVSSFGAGGANAHLIVEEYVPDPVADSRTVYSSRSSELVVLSARNPARLRAAAEQMLSFVEHQQEILLSNLAYTLQVGREAMSGRLALVVKTREELIEGLRAFLKQAESSIPIYSQEASDGALLVEKTLEDADKNLEELARHWVQGGTVAWESIHQGRVLRRMALPTYPFERRRFPIAPPSGLVNGGTPSTTEALRSSATENSVVAIILELLRLEPEDLSLTKSLDQYGMDSILFMRLVQQLQTRIDSSITVEQLQGCESVKDIVAILPVADKRPRDAPPVQKSGLRLTWPQFPELIRLNQSWKGRPVFWLHPALGGVEVYKGLAQVSPRPFYAIQARGWLTDRSPLHGVQAMVAYYAHIIQTVQPEGPYDLGGYSFGGVLAYELTRQLQELGQPVHTLVMLDSHDSSHTRRIKLSPKSEILQTVNTALAAMVSNQPEKALETLIRRDQLDICLSDEDFLKQLVHMAKQRGLPQSEAQLRALIRQSAKVQKAYEIRNFTVLPLPHPEDVTCYYFRNKGGAFWGQLEPFNVINLKETPLDNKEYWSEWKANLPNLHVVDVDCHSHPTLLFESKTAETIFEFCEHLYSQDRMTPECLESFKQKARTTHGVRADVTAKKKFVGKRLQNLPRSPARLRAES